MDQETQNLVLEQFKSLPKDIQGAIVSSGYKQKLNELFRKHQLHVDQAGTLETETTMVMLGITHPDDFVENIKKNVEVEEEKARAIASDVNSQIFMPIRQSLMKLHEGRDAEPEIQNPKPQVQTPVTPPPPVVKTYNPKPVTYNTENQEKSEKSLVESKVGSVMKMPAQEITLKETVNKQPTTNDTKKNYLVDPYREPLK